MSALGIAALIASITAAVGATGAAAGGIWNSVGSKDVYSSDLGVDLRKAAIDRASSNENAAAMEELFNNLSESELRALESEYLISANGWENAGGLFGGQRRKVDVDRLLKDLEATVGKLPDAPQAVDMSQYLGEEALANRTAELTAPLDEMRERRQTAYEDELRGIRDDYRSARRGLLSSQYQQNAQIMDNMSSEMSRARRNALEAGASAGMRLADNINIMLSNQNKQAQTSLETSNQLAQMLVNQRAASQNATNSWNSYMMQDYNARNAARNQAYTEGQRQYDVAQSEYESKLNDWESAYGGNPVSSYYRSAKAKGNYNNSGT